MSTTTRIPPIDELLKDADRVVLHNVAWGVYVGLRDDDAHRHLRMEYIEEPSSSRPRDTAMRSTTDDSTAWCGNSWSRWDPLACAGSTTLRREDDEAGKESDTCFYLAHEPLIRDKDEIDLAVDPPPDLAIEVDDSNDSRDKLPIYAALRVPEVWRTMPGPARSGLVASRSNGTYTPIPRSDCLPLLTPERVLHALALCRGVPSRAGQSPARVGPDVDARAWRGPRGTMIGDRRSKESGW